MISVKKMHHTGHCRARAQAREAVRSHTGVPVKISVWPWQRCSARKARRPPGAERGCGSGESGVAVARGERDGGQHQRPGARGSRSARRGGRRGRRCVLVYGLIALPATLLLFFESSLICRRGVPFCHIISMLSFVTPYTAIFHLSTDDSVEGVYRYSQLSHGHLSPGPGNPAA